MNQLALAVSLRACFSRASLDNLLPYPSKAVDSSGLAAGETTEYVSLQASDQALSVRIFLASQLDERTQQRPCPPSGEGQPTPLLTTTAKLGAGKFYTLLLRGFFTQNSIPPALCGTSQTQTCATSTLSAAQLVEDRVATAFSWRAALLSPNLATVDVCARLATGTRLLFANLSYPQVSNYQTPASVVVGSQALELQAHNASTPCQGVAVASFSLPLPQVSSASVTQLGIKGAQTLVVRGTVSSTTDPLRAYLYRDADETLTPLEDGGMGDAGVY